MEKAKTLSDYKDELRRLTEHYYICCDPRVRAAIEVVRKENEPKVAELQRKIENLRLARKLVTRWPDCTPDNVKKVCEDYWSGTTEKHTYRIHLWNDKAVWTSYPAGGYSTVGGFTPTPPAYELISRTELAYKNSSKKVAKKLKGLCFERNSGKRVTPAMMQAELDKL